MTALAPLIVATTGGAQTPGEHPVHWTVRSTRLLLLAGDTARVALHATIGEFFHLYSTTQGPGGPVPTTVELLPNQRFALIGKVRSPAPDTIPDGNFGIMTEVHDDSVTLSVALRADTSLAPGRTTASIGVRYQACTARFCLPPRTDTLVVAVSITGRAMRVVAGVAEPAMAATTKPTDRTQPVVEQQSSFAAFGAPGAPGSATAFLLLAASMGALALLTPCVFPMIPITVTSFLGSADDRSKGDRRRGVRRASLYALGIVGSFTGLGVLTALVFGASGLARFSANPVVNLGIAAMFIVFALSLIGAVRLALPVSFIARVTQSNVGGDAGGPLLMGALFTLTAFTCTAPFVGTLLVVAAAGQWTWPLIGMLVFSTVFAAPFFLLALVPGLLQHRPRAGEWMPTLELILGAVELGAAVKFISNADLVLGWGVFTRTVVVAIWIAILAGLAVVLGYRAVKRGAFRFPIPALVPLAAMAVLTPGLAGRRLGELEAFLPPMAVVKSEELPWILNAYDRALADARASSRPILIDFTGYTCTNCRWMEANMFPRGEVKTALEKFVRVRLYTDGLGEPYLAQQRLEQRLFGTVALPLYAALDANGKPVATFLGMTRDAAEFTAFLARGSGAR